MLETVPNKSHVRGVRAVAGAMTLLVLSLVPTSARGQYCAMDTVPRAELAAAVRVASRSHGDYDILATTNWGRFESALYLSLVRARMQREPAGGVLFISADDLFHEFLEVAGLSGRPEDAPEPRRLAYAYDQGVQIDYRPDSIIKEVKKGPTPTLALNVRVAWPDRPDGSRRFSFVDTLSVPQLKVTNRQVITYRFVDFGDMVLHDEMDGLSGRPLTGLLGALFKVLGEGSVKYSRDSYSDDGLQIVRARAKKIFSKTATVTIGLDGRAEKDVPPDRPDLVEIAERLEEDVELEYYDYRCW